MALVVSIGHFWFYFVCSFHAMEYVSCGSFLIASLVTINAHTHFQQTFKALK